jgi:Ser/Thr protein kinase RdoA (MazF antagonist)
MTAETNFHELLAPWGLRPAAAPRIVGDGVFQLTLADGRQVVLKALGPIQEWKLRHLEFERDVLLHVEQTGLAVAVPLLTAAGQPYNLAGGQVYSLSRWLPNGPAEVRDDHERVQLYRSYGTAIARFHQALVSYVDPALAGRTWRTDLQQGIFVEALPTIAAGLEPAQWLALKARLEPIEPAMRAALRTCRAN